MYPPFRAAWLAIRCRLRFLLMMVSICTAFSRALDHQSFRNRQNRRAMLHDQGFRLGKAEQQIRIDCGVTGADIQY
jgi:hypothetical protein